MRNNLVILSSSLLIIIFTVIFTLPNKNISNKKDVAAPGCEVSDFSGIIDAQQMLAVFEGKEISVSNLAMIPDVPNNQILGVAQEERWVEVDLSEQKLIAWEGDKLFLETPISSGLPHTPTPTGEFRIWIKLRATKMEGGEGAYYYYLPNVPYVMFFSNSEVPQWKGYGLHGTYWHEDFGNPRSHGCVNLPTPVAKELYYWTMPNLPEGTSVVRSNINSPGTRIVIHE